MNSLKTLYFPGTDFYSIRQFPIFLLFQKIHLIKPVEERPAGPAGQSADSFIKSGFCQVHTPCPLGGSRDRFLHLVKDIRNRKDDYAAQLSSLILAEQSRPAASDEDSEQAIISSLFTPDDRKTKSLQAEKEGKLWQARLVLAIGEILDQEEEEIARDLAILEDDQAGLFKQLHGDIEELDDDSPLAEPHQLESKLGAANSGNIRKRFNAWKTLFLEGDVPACEIFLTTSRDGGDLLLEAYEKRTDRPALSAAILELPGLIGWNGSEAVQSVRTFSEKNQELLSRLRACLTDLSHQEPPPAGKTITGNAMAQLAGEWNARLETDFPANQFGRIPVTCYLFPGLSCSALLGKPQAVNDEAKNGLLVVVD
jgi:hypothetical protein